MNAPWRFVLFDLDGTLVDTSPLHDRGYREALSIHRPDLLEGFRYDRITGLTTESAFERLGVVDANEREVLVRAKRAGFADAVDRLGVRAFPGAHSLLVDLRRRGIASYVVTSASRRGASFLVRATGIAPYLRGMIAAEDVVHGKPSPEPFLLALKRFGLRPHEGVVLEDADSGLAAARAAGLAAIRVNSGDGVRLSDFARSVSETFCVPAGRTRLRLPNSVPTSELRRGPRR